MPSWPSLSLTAVMAGLVPAIPIEDARSCPLYRDPRDKPAGDAGEWGFQEKELHYAFSYCMRYRDVLHRVILGPEGRLLGAFLQGGPGLWCPRTRLAAAPGRLARPAPPGNDDPCGDARSRRECRTNGEHGPGPEIPRGAPKGERSR